MIATTAMNLSTPQAKIEESLAADEAKIAELTAPGEDGKLNINCGLNIIAKKLSGKKSECDKIRETMEINKESLERLKKKEAEFQATYPQL